MHAPDRASELEEFKTRINLTAYMAELGYELDEKATSRNSAVMVHRNGDKLIVGRGHDQHWIYFSVRDDQDHGSIIDFDQARSGGSLGDVRKRLRPWVGRTASPPHRYAPDLEPISKDTMKVRAELSRMLPPELSRRYLEHERKIPAKVLDDERFAGRIVSDRRNNAIFPHWNADGICGYEIKNHGFTGFAPGGVKGLWCSRSSSGDTRLVIAETAIDALSYAALFGSDKTRFVSTAGQFNPEQPELIIRAVRKLYGDQDTREAPRPIDVVLAFDNDEGGDDLSESLTPLLQGCGLSIQVERKSPQMRGRDWNDALTNV